MGIKSKISFTAVQLVVLFAIVVFEWGCANIVPPTGGPEDKTPPQLLAQTPKDSVLNQMVYKITLHFNKFMEVHDLDKNLTTSPLLKILPTVVSKGKSVVITLPDSSLKPNTTYRIALRNALTDNREQTPYQNFTYIFSTGPFFDSLRLKGQVTDARTGLPDTSASVFLYPSDLKDSAILNTRPEYVRKTHSDGSFEFDGLPNRAFKIFAITDGDNNFIFSPGSEKIDFSDTLAVPKINPDSGIHFYVFKQELAEDTGHIKHKSGQDSVLSPAQNRFNKSHPGNHSANPPAKSAKTGDQPDYLVLADTSELSKGTFDITQPLRIKLNKVIKTSDSNRIYLSFDDNGTEVEAIHQLKIDSSEIKITPQWQADKVYTLRLIKGWATDSSGNELSPGKFSFRTQSLKDYANLNVRMDSSWIGKKYLLVLLSEEREVWKGAVEKNITNIPLLKPGDYTLRLIFDANENGHWDSGNVFKKQHAERVIPYSGSIPLKAGWTNDVDFKKGIAPVPSATSEEGQKRGRFTGKQPETQSQPKPDKK